MGRNWTNKDNFSRRAHQDLINRIDDVEVFSAVGDMLVEGAKNRSVADLRTELYDLRALAVIVPGETALYEFDDPRYRCKIQKILDQAAGLANETDIQEQLPGATSPAEGDTDTTGPVPGWTVTAINTAEIKNPATLEGTHDLREDGTYVVEIFGRYDRTDPPKLRWWFTSYNIPHGQYRGMVLQVVANNAIGYDWTLAHAGLD